MTRLTRTLIRTMIRDPLQDRLTLTVAAGYIAAVCAVVWQAGMMVALVVAAAVGTVAAVADLADAVRVWQIVARDGHLSYVFILRASINLRSQVFKLGVLTALIVVGIAVEQPRPGTLIALLAVGVWAAADSLLDWTDRRRELAEIRRTVPGRPL